MSRVKSDGCKNRRSVRSSSDGAGHLLFSFLVGAPSQKAVHIASSELDAAGDSALHLATWLRSAELVGILPVTT